MGAILRPYSTVAGITPERGREQKLAHMGGSPLPVEENHTGPSPGLPRRSGGYRGDSPGRRTRMPRSSLPTPPALPYRSMPRSHFRPACVRGSVFSTISSHPRRVICTGAHPIGRVPFRYGISAGSLKRIPSAGPVREGGAGVVLFSAVRLS